MHSERESFGVIPWVEDLARFIDIKGIQSQSGACKCTHPGFPYMGHYIAGFASGMETHAVMAVCDRLIEKNAKFYIPYFLTSECSEIRKHVKEKHGTIPI